MLALFGILSMIGVVAIMFRVYLAYRESQKIEDPEPMTEAVLKQYDDLPSGMAIYLSWVGDDTTPRLQKKLQESVRAQMPVLARALDRMVEED